MFWSCAYKEIWWENNDGSYGIERKWTLSPYPGSYSWNLLAWPCPDYREFLWPGALPWHAFLEILFKLLSKWTFLLKPLSHRLDGISLQPSPSWLYFAELLHLFSHLREKFQEKPIEYSGLSHHLERGIFLYSSSHINQPWQVQKYSWQNYWISLLSFAQEYMPGSVFIFKNCSLIQKPSTPIEVCFFIVAMMTCNFQCI